MLGGRRPGAGTSIPETHTIGPVSRSLTILRAPCDCCGPRDASRDSIPRQWVMAFAPLPCEERILQA